MIDAKPERAVLTYRFTVGNVVVRRHARDQAVRGAPEREEHGRAEEGAEAPGDERDEEGVLDVLPARLRGELRPREDLYRNRGASRMSALAVWGGLREEPHADLDSPVPMVVVYELLGMHRPRSYIHRPSVPEARARPPRRTRPRDVT